ncbi:Hypothetical protein NTJ_13650 [Nesidiocoris tenuis]|uniref:Uncharacterized protein n=1 Tax=Nesidiocoris tenuis TaxID=355587 RepID=A0ABN7B968_9HEMI|nr:Hypothetical protein NTJ_13650 [Nesidiocoris tenuis]
MAASSWTDLRLWLVLAGCFQVILSGMNLDECIKGKDIPASSKASLMEFKLAEEAEMMCVQVCLVQKARWLNEDGTINKVEVHKVNKVLVNDPKREAEIINIVEICVKGQSGGTPCERGVSAFKCIVSNYQAAGFNDVLEKAREYLQA